MDDSDFAVITLGDLQAWAAKLHDLTDITNEQAFVITNFLESASRLCERRGELHLSAIQFHEVKTLNTTTMQVQNEFYNRTESYFHSYYSLLSQLASLAHRFPEPFLGIKKSSNKAFLEGLKKKYTDLSNSIDVLEKARAHRAFIDHPVSNQVSNWMTYTTGDRRRIAVLYFGYNSRSGSSPEGSDSPKGWPVSADWKKTTPSYFEIEQALVAVINRICDLVHTAYTNKSPKKRKKESLF